MIQEDPVLLHKDESLRIIKPNNDDSEFSYVFLFIFLSFMAGPFVRTAIKYTYIDIPYRILLVGLGALLGTISKMIPTIKPYIGSYGSTPDIILMAFMPILMFKAAFFFKFQLTAKNTSIVVFCSIFGFSIAIGALCVCSYYGVNPSWDYALSAASGIFCSPVYLMELISKLRTFAANSCRNSVDWYEITQLVVSVAETLFGGGLLGLLAGKTAYLVPANARGDARTEITILTLVCSYLAFHCAERLLPASGGIAALTAGAVAGSVRQTLPPDVELFVSHFWDIVSYLADTAVNVMVGAVIADRITDETQMAVIALTYVINAAWWAPKVLGRSRLAHQARRLRHQHRVQDAVVQGPDNHVPSIIRGRG